MVWRSGQRYSEDLRARVLAAVDGGMAARAAASVFQVSVSYIYKALIRRQQTGEVSARPVSGHRPRKLTPEQEAALAAHVLAHSDMTLAAMQAWLESEYEVRLSSGAVWTIIDRLGLSFKKRRSEPASKSGRTWRRGDASGKRLSPLSIRTGSSSSTTRRAAQQNRRQHQDDASLWTIASRYEADSGSPLRPLENDDLRRGTEAQWTHGAHGARWPDERCGLPGLRRTGARADLAA